MPRINKLKRGKRKPGVGPARPSNLGHPHKGRSMEVRLKKVWKEQQLGIPNDYSLSRRGLNLLEVTAELCRKSFYDFVVEFWNTLEPTPFTDNWHIRYLCDELQLMAEEVIAGRPKQYDLIINISPGSTKSTLISIMLPAWLWTRMPSGAVIGASHTYALAVDLSRKNRVVVKSEKYHDCFPEIKVALDQDAKGFFINTKGGARFSAGVDGDVTGRHGHLILVDDPINPKGGRSESDTENANIFIKETLANRKKDPLVTPMIVIMQRLSENDPTGMMLEEWPDPLKHICLPAEIKKGAVIKPPELEKFYTDGIMNPYRHPKEYLEKEAGRGEYYYAGQYLQSPIPLGGAMFHVERFNIEAVPPTKWKMRIRYWDKAGTKDSGAYSTGVLMGRDMDDRYWVLDVVRGQWDTYRRERIIRQTAEMDGGAVIIGVEQEPGSAGKESAQNTVRNLAGFSVRMDRPTGDKAQRADPYSSQVNAGHVYLLKAAWNRPYVAELRYFSLENKKYKDQVDASSGAFKFLSLPIIRAGGWRL